MLSTRKRNKHDRCISRSHKSPKALNSFDLRIGRCTGYVARVNSVSLCVPWHFHADTGAEQQAIAMVFNRGPEGRLSAACYKESPLFVKPRDLCARQYEEL